MINADFQYENPIYLPRKTENNKMAAQISSLLIQKEKEKGLNMKDDELRLASLRYDLKLSILINIGSYYLLMFVST